MDNDIVKGWLEQSKLCGQIIELLSDALIILKGKRVTLEEKAIAVYWHRLAVGYALVIETLHRRLPAENQNLPDDLLRQLEQLNQNTLAVLSDFLKMARYDANFLEQYFEHDFHSRLLADYRLQEQLDAVASRLKTTN